MILTEGFLANGGHHYDGFAIVQKAMEKTVSTAKIVA
jgi:hypothetical protein